MGILSLDPRDNTIGTIVDRFHGELLKGPYDLIVDADGVTYFTDHGMTGLHDNGSCVPSVPQWPA
jgi:sugar lactone lactonase YvrE